MRGVPWWVALVGLGFHGLLVGWLTWPLAAHAATHLPFTNWVCGCDTLNAAWSLTHQSRVLLAAPLSLAEGNIYWPARHTFLYGEAGFGALPYFLPPFWLTGNPALALNLTFLVSLTLTATALQIVVWRWTGSILGGLVAGATFLMNRWLLWTWVPAAPNYAVLQYLPFIILLAATPAATVGRALRLVPLIVLQGLSSIYIAAATLGPLGILGLARLARRATRRAGARLLVAVGVAALGIALTYTGSLVVITQNPSWSKQSFWPVGTTWTSLPGGLLDASRPTGVPVATLLLIAVGAVVRRLARSDGSGHPQRIAWQHGTLWTLAGVGLSLGPMVRWLGTPIPVPQGFIAQWVPIYRVLRAVDRIGVAALMGLGLLAGIAFAECASRLGTLAGRLGERVIPAALAVAVLTTTYAGYAWGVGAPASVRLGPLPPAYPLQPAIAGESPILQILKAPGGPLLELPVPLGLGGVPGPVPQARAMYRSIFHGRMILNGYHSYWPEGFAERMALARRLPDPDALRQLRNQTGLEMLFVHSADLAQADRSKWLDLSLAERDDLRLVARDGDELLFAVR
jgi:hypothetical protein